LPLDRWNGRTVGRRGERCLGSGVGNERDIGIRRNGRRRTATRGQARGRREKRHEHNREDRGFAERCRRNTHSGRDARLSFAGNEGHRIGAARTESFNGIAATLEAEVRHYETHLGFVFTDQQRADLVAFLKAL